MTTADLEKTARTIRGKIITMSHRSGAAHLGSALSCVDILVAAYWKVLNIDPAAPASADRDRLILSKGHAAAALYSVLAYRGFFPLDLLDTFAAPGSCLAEHPLPRSVPGLEVATGSLGHGLSVGIGMAVAGRLQNRSFRVYVVMSDGECNEGAVWEAALFAPVHRLDNVVVIIDYNKWQATGRSNEVMGLESLRQKWESFGWSAREVDGHDIDALASALTSVPDGTGRPVALIAHTIKGKGVSFMEDDNNWHYRIPNAEEVAKAFEELWLK